ncbi:MAG TPA: non-canonical purine NTP pyrophosphatase [Bacilli bacterium]|nr:non-canonical purine NTP pyrophosphatase [Bacilli bacterium]
MVFVTHNKGKVASAQKQFDKIKFKTYDYELTEPRSDDIKEIACSKVLEAYQIVKTPCIALDSGFYIEELNDFPRAFVNFTLDTIGIDGILKLMKDVENRNCMFKECLAYYDGIEIKCFYGESRGKLSCEVKGNDKKEKWSDLWYIFKPNGFDKTLAEMTVEERETRRMIDKSTNSFTEFADWYINSINSDKIKKLTKK